MDKKNGRRLTGILPLLLTVAVLVSAQAAAYAVWQKTNAPRYHYELSKDLGIAFTNADQVIEQIRRSLQAHDGKIIIDYVENGDHMEDISELVRELVDCALSETEDPAQGDYMRYQLGGYELEYGYEV